MKNSTETEKFGINDITDISEIVIMHNFIFLASNDAMYLSSKDRKFYHWHDESNNIRPNYEFSAEELKEIRNLVKENSKKNTTKGCGQYWIFHKDSQKIVRGEVTKVETTISTVETATSKQKTSEIIYTFQINVGNKPVITITNPSQLFKTKEELVESLIMK